MRDSETEGFRPPPRTPYRLNPAVLRVPRAAVDLTLAICQRSGRLETCCFWYGNESTVSAVVVPRQQQTWGNYFVSAEAMRQIHERVSPRGLRNLAQVHSHPGKLVEHSSYDDEMANSRRVASIVVPNYGRWSGRWPVGVGVHEYQDGYWHLLSDTEAAQRVVLGDVGEVELLDCR